MRNSIDIGCDNVILREIAMYRVYIDQINRAWAEEKAQHCSCVCRCFQSVNIFIYLYFDSRRWRIIREIWVRLISNLIAYPICLSQVLHRFKLQRCRDNATRINNVVFITCMTHAFFTRYLACFPLLYNESIRKYFLLLYFVLNNVWQTAFDLSTFSLSDRNSK